MRKVIVAYDNTEPDEEKLALALYRKLKEQKLIKVQNSKFKDGIRIWYSIYCQDYTFEKPDVYTININMAELDAKYKP